MWHEWQQSDPNSWFVPKALVQITRHHHPVSAVCQNNTVLDKHSNSNDYIQWKDGINCDFLIFKEQTQCFCNQVTFKTIAWEVHPKIKGAKMSKKYSPIEKHLNPFHTTVPPLLATVLYPHIIWCSIASNNCKNSKT